MQSQVKQKRPFFMMSNGVGLPGAKRKRGFSFRRGGTPCSQTGAQGCQRLWLMHKEDGISPIGILSAKLRIGGQTQRKS